MHLSETLSIELLTCNYVFFNYGSVNSNSSFTTTVLLSLNRIPILKHPS